MTLETYNKALNLQDLGSLTQPCPKCGKETKIRDFNWVRSRCFAENAILGNQMRLTDIKVDAALRLAELGVTKEQLEANSLKREHVKDFLAGNGILVVRRFPALNGSPWEGPILQCFDPAWNMRSAFEMMMVDCDD